jgi:uncharacterized protein YneF (UPF0154 family)
MRILYFLKMRKRFLDICKDKKIAFVICKLSLYTNKQNTNHWKAIARVFGYLKRTAITQFWIPKNYFLKYIFKNPKKKNSKSKSIFETRGDKLSSCKRSKY